jgi:hypothetical protein
MFGRNKIRWQSLVRFANAVLEGQKVHLGLITGLTESLSEVVDNQIWIIKEQTKIIERTAALEKVVRGIATSDLENPDG